jgi:phosphate transport system substrate-binding protein
MKSRLTAAIAALSLVAVAAITSPAFAETSLTGAGSSYANKFMVACDEKSTDFTVNYASVGSGSGRTQFAAGTVDFGASDSASSALSLTGSRAGGKYTYIPVVGGPIAMLYNLKSQKIKNGELRFTPAVIAGIFKGNITKWNAKQIKSLQTPAVAKKLPNLSIQVVYRGTSSGTSENLTNYLNQTAPAVWPHAKNGLIYTDGSATAPAGAVSSANSQEMITQLKAANGRIGYADLSDAVTSRGVPVVAAAQVKNASNQWVLPSSEAASKFLETFYEDEFNAKTGAVTLSYTKKVKGAYNLSLLTYVVADKASDLASADKTEAWVRYLIRTCGPLHAKSLGYSPISGNLRTAALSLAANITD